ncbi:hypothetical protein C7M84_018388 [Penaeus vannamei]|uniref:GT23 domain-containing protein n=1 Tax=Penaeus vannamei TaxID=6689 RepID=A0A3R7LT20_PENVA|nr:hypothetical protein C7M84_018388 [Penaeus vannamei]
MAAQAPSPPGTNDTHVVSFPDTDKPKPRPNYFPRSVPRDFGQRLVKVHGDPFAWWMGQFFKYAMRMTEGFQEYVEKLGARLGFESPIVGIQVRRTDKLRHDSRFIELEEYMEVVDDFFDDLEVRGTNVTTRRIYLATDDPGVLQEAKKFPNYKFVFNEDSVASASLGRRGSVDNMKYLMADILFLSRSDFLVCGMSSNLQPPTLHSNLTLGQICRLAYELMQTLHSDATRKLLSLDLPYCFHFQGAHEVEARFPHTPRSYCFLAAYGTQRTLIVNERKSKMEFSTGTYFLPSVKTVPAIIGALRALRGQFSLTLFRFPPFPVILLNPFISLYSVSAFPVHLQILAAT